MGDIDSLLQVIDNEDRLISRKMLSRWLGGFGYCQICGLWKKLHVDHNHATQYFRGMLCRECNLGLGLFSENIVSLQNAVAYLERHKEVIT